MTKPWLDTCRMCATTQTVNRGKRKSPRMYRAGDGSVQCSDPIECLARRHELIEKMQAALDMVWKFVDEHSPGGDCGDVRGQSPRPELFPPGSVRRLRRAANVGATIFHRVFMPMWISLGGSHKWVA